MSIKLALNGEEGNYMQELTTGQLIILLSYLRGTEEIDSRNVFYRGDRDKLIQMELMQLVAKDETGGPVYQLTSTGQLRAQAACRGFQT